MVNCPNCGVLVEKDSKFCQECGTKIDNSDSNTQTDVSSDYEKNKRYNWIFRAGSNLLNALDFMHSGTGVERLQF